MQPQPQPYQPRQSHRKFDIIGCLIIVSLVLLAFFACILPMFGSQIGMWVTSQAPVCTIGAQGTSVVITVQSWSANDDCRALSYDKDNFSGADLTGLGLAPVSASDTSGLTIQCEVDANNRHIAVRSGELSLLAAKVMCDKLHGLSY